MQAQLVLIEGQLRQPGLDAGERAQHEYDAQQLRDRIRVATEGRNAQQASVAITPMLLRYGSGELVPGFAPPPTFAQTLQASGDTFLGAASVLLRLVLALLPWALTAGLLAWIGARVRRRWFPAAALHAPLV